MLLVRMPGAYLLLAAGRLFALIAGVVLFKTAWNLRKNNTQPLYYNLIIGVLLWTQLAIPFTDWEVRFFNYLLLAVIFTMKLNDVVIKKVESQVLSLVMLELIVFVVSDTVLSENLWLQKFQDLHSL